MTQPADPKTLQAGAKVKVKNKAKDKQKRVLHQQIDENLRRVYEEALVQEIPDRFAQLLQQLRMKETGS